MYLTNYISLSDNTDPLRFHCYRYFHEFCWNDLTSIILRNLFGHTRSSKNLPLSLPNLNNSGLFSSSILLSMFSRTRLWNSLPEDVFTSSPNTQGQTAVKCAQIVARRLLLLSYIFVSQAYMVNGNEGFRKLLLC